MKRITPYILLFSAFLLFAAYFVEGLEQPYYLTLGLIFLSLAILLSNPKTRAKLLNTKKG